jgi:hypothetical protein
VTCDICFKEVCNKYFLRTHKQKKHGIAPSEGGSGSPLSGSPAPSENDASSNHSSQPDNFLLDRSAHRPTDSMASSMPTSIPLPPSERSGSALKAGSDRPDGASSRLIKTEEEKNFLLHGKLHHNNNNNHSTSNNNREGGVLDGVTCHLCDRKFRNMQWLSAHLMKDHAEAFHPEFMDPHFLPPFGPAAAAAAAAAAAQFGADLEPKMCHFCRQFLPNDISLQLHLINEHNAQIKLMEDSHMRGPKGPFMPRSQEEMMMMMMMMNPAGSSRTVGLKAVKPWRMKAARKQGLRALGKHKMYVCSSCPYRTHWLSRLHAHEDCKHRRSKASDDESAVDTDEDIPKQFKCRLCPSRFSSHAFCQAHVREAHIHMLKDFVARKRDATVSQRLTCSLCPFSTAYPFRLHSHMSRFHRRYRRARVQPRTAAAALTNGHDLDKRMADSSPDRNLEVSSVSALQDAASPQRSPEPALEAPFFQRPLSLEAPSFQRPLSSDEELMKPPSFHISGLQDEEEDDMDEDEDDDREAVAATAVSLADSYLGMRQHGVHESVAVSSSFRVAEVTP